MLPCKPPEESLFALTADEASSFDEARAVLIPFGLEKSVSYEEGTAQAPRAILEASSELEPFDEEYWCEAWRRYGFVTLHEPPIADSLPAALNQLDGIVEAVLAAGKFPLTLGGEHTLTAGAIRPFARRYPRLGVLHFDAHADLRDSFRGERHSHACALRRVLDNPEVTQLVSVGIRNISADEIPFFDSESRSERLHIFFTKDRARWSLEDILRPLEGLPVYLTFDVDGFDSSLMPATGTPEPGGLLWDETIAIIRAAGERLNLVGADIVELAPRPGLHACDFLAAKLAYKILSAAFLARASRSV